MLSSTCPPAGGGDPEKIKRPDSGSNPELQSIMFKKNFSIFSILFLFLSFPVLAAQSENYKINADVFGISGGLGTSESYKLTDTVGEPIIGVGTSENYKSRAGFWYMVTSSISINLDSETVDLGTLTPGTPRIGQSVLTVVTDAWGGYDLSIKEDGLMTHSDNVTTIANFTCLISSPCLWSGTGLGFTVKSGTGIEEKWGTSPNYKYAAIPLDSTLFHERQGYSSGNDETIVEYKIDAPAEQKSGNYSNIVTYTAMAKL